MLDLSKIKECPLSSQTIYDMINSCLEAAEDNGFLNQFVFERALTCHEVLQLIEDLDDIDAPMVAENPLVAFDHFIEMGYIDQLIKYHPDTVAYLGQISAQYFEDYEKYLLSLGGVINKASIFSSEVLQNMVNQVSTVSNNEDIVKTLQIANDWGMNRQTPIVEEPIDSQKFLDSLLNE